MSTYREEHCPECKERNYLWINENIYAEDIAYYTCWHCFSEIALLLGEFGEDYHPHLSGLFPEDGFSLGYHTYGLKELPGDTHRPNTNVELIHKVLGELPTGIQKVLGTVHFVIDRDPFYIGLERGRLLTSDGRKFSEESHVCGVWSQEHLPRDQREPTVVLIKDAHDKLVILHELGHILDYRLDCFRPYVWAMDDYAETNQMEAFATAFQSWAIEKGDNYTYYHTREQLYEVDPHMVHWFNALAKGEPRTIVV